MTTFLLVLNGAGVLLLVFLFAWSKWTNGKPKTTPEAATRGLYYLARWLRSLAEGLDTGILAYRDTKRGDLCPPRAEVDRILRSVKFERLEAGLRKMEGLGDDAAR